jgi:hypothetical protein
MGLQDYAPGHAVEPVDGLGKHFIVKVRADFSAKPLAAADTAKLIEIKAGWFVKDLWAKIISPESAADTFNLGDSAAPDNWDAAVAANAAAGTVTRTNHAAGGDANGVSEGKYYSAADYILLTPSAELAQLVLEVAIEVLLPF